MKSCMVTASKPLLLLRADALITLDVEAEGEEQRTCCLILCLFLQFSAYNIVCKLKLRFK